PRAGRSDEALDRAPDGRRRTAEGDRTQAYGGGFRAGFPAGSSRRNTVDLGGSHVRAAGADGGEPAEDARVHARIGSGAHLALRTAGGGPDSFREARRRGRRAARSGNVRALDRDLEESGPRALRDLELRQAGAP